MQSKKVQIILRFIPSSPSVDLKGDPAVTWQSEIDIILKLLQVPLDLKATVTSMPELQPWQTNAPPRSRRLSRSFGKDVTA
jgi:hypothetical protein